MIVKCFTHKATSFTTLDKGKDLFWRIDVYSIILCGVFNDFMKEDPN